MGVPRFYKYVTDKWPEIKIDKLPRIDNLYIDLNGIIHMCAQKVFNPEERPENVAFTRNQLERRVYKEIGAYLILLCNVCKPQECLYIAIDGVAPLAKQTQQRQRRFKNGALKTLDELENFDSTCITPGTRFMNNLSIFFNHFIRKTCMTNKYWQKLTVIFSDSTIPGEGEHKIVNYIRTCDKAKSHCLYGLDADLFMLGLSVHLKQVYLIREDQYSKNDQYVHFIKLYIGALAECISMIRPDFDENIVINDFILLTFLLGNDFLHALPCFNLLEQSLSFLLDIYKTLPCPLTGAANSINMPSLLSLFERISEHEYTLIKTQNALLKYPVLSFNDCSINCTDPLKTMSEYKTLHYKQIGVDAAAHCFEYLQGLDWVHNYYHASPKNWRWTFPYYHSPFASDLVKFIKSGQKIPRVSQRTCNPISINQQLLCVIPPQSMKLLPHKILEQYNQLKEMYMPDTFELLYEGKNADWMAVAKIPFIDINTVIKILDDPIVHAKSAQMFKYDPSVSFDYTSFYGTINNCQVLATFL